MRAVNRNGSRVDVLRPVAAIDIGGNAVFDRFVDAAPDLAGNAPRDVLFMAASADRNVPPFIQGLSSVCRRHGGFIPVDIAGTVAFDRYLVTAVLKPSNVRPA